jgi:hypothetical protein
LVWDADKKILCGRGVTKGPCCGVKMTQLCTISIGLSSTTTKEDQCASPQDQVNSSRIVKFSGSNITTFLVLPYFIEAKLKNKIFSKTNLHDQKSKYVPFKNLCRVRHLNLLPNQKTYLAKRV